MKIVDNNMATLFTRSLRFVALTICLLFSPWLKAELTIEITQGIDNPTRIAVAPFGWDGSPLPENLDQIVENDLQRSGQFSTVPKRDMLSFPRSEADVYYRDWRMLGSEYLLLANMEQMPEGDYQLTFELYDVLSQVRLLRKGWMVNCPNCEIWPTLSVIRFTKPLPVFAVLFLPRLSMWKLFPAAGSG